MRTIETGEEALRSLFTGLIEQTFQTELGIADPSLTDYLSEMLVRFCRVDAIFSVRDLEGKRLEEIAEMLVEAEQRIAAPKRELHRHIGDFALFWSGVFPDALARLQAPMRKDHLIDYCEQGRRSYYIASTFDSDPFGREAPVLRRLSEEFDVCREGLNRVRSEWANLPTVGRSIDHGSSGSSDD
ncbi:hypothetical protein [Stratiformator vulcanicus]|uniref:Uncharacterized protein n=1 Tax=Stratiformator vulcanicus TaxID=2527980 RepID=A0A517R4Z3_9PLAN|nr:hypothetical protein [Stratiformator vulcanicus]QDT38956.1 hypothetical protein Pan189_33560 [Stratiformator vulcanicus]